MKMAPVRERGRARGRGVQSGSAGGRGRGLQSGSARGRGRDRRAQAAPDGNEWAAQDVARNVRAYGGVQGPCRRMPVTATPKDFIAEFMDDQVWDLMVRVTNMNAHHKRQAGQHKGVWQPIDVLEMQAFVGMIIITGIVRLPRLAMY